MKRYKRPTWDEYFLDIMDTVATRATCDRGRVGCVIARDKRIIATGYAGAPSGAKHCDEIGHEMVERIDEDGKKSSHCIRTAHAEQNAIVHAARVGSSLENSTLYCNMTPCYACAKMIVNAGIVRVIARQDYHAGERSKELFREVGLKFELLDSTVKRYSRQ